MTQRRIALATSSTSAAPSFEPPTIVGHSGALAQSLAELRRVARSSTKVLITGESGVGKELIARYIHAGSLRSDRPFIAINCAALPEPLFVTELFGHVKGSFTDAHRNRPGKFREADTGTLFLDEISEMSPRMQGALLRVLEHGEVDTVGGDGDAAPVDCRIIAATNRSLSSMIEDGTFRADLFYRLNVFRVRVPPLRERKDDIPLLVRFFLARIAEDYGIVRHLSPALEAALEAHDWPGNVRELQNVTQRLALTSCEAVMTVADLPDDFGSRMSPADASIQAPAPDEVASRLHAQLRSGESFWTAVHHPYIHREIRREDLRAVVRKGLEDARGSYRVLMRQLNVAPADARRALNFLRKHHCLEEDCT